MNLGDHIRPESGGPALTIGEMAAAVRFVARERPGAVEDLGQNLPHPRRDPAVLTRLAALGTAVERVEASLVEPEDLFPGTIDPGTEGHGGSE